MSIDHDSRSEEKNEVERKNLRMELVTIQEKTDSGDLDQMIRKRSFSLNGREDLRPCEEEGMFMMVHLESVRRVLNMIDLDN